MSPERVGRHAVVVEDLQGLSTDQLIALYQRAASKHGEAPEQLARPAILDEAGRQASPSGSATTGLAWASVAPYLWWGRPSTSVEAGGRGQCWWGYLLPVWVSMRGRPALSRCTDGLRRRDDRSGVSRERGCGRSVYGGRTGAGRWRREQCGSWPQGHLRDGGRRAQGLLVRRRHGRPGCLLARR
jgi:hypothetical protein